MVRISGKYYGIAWPTKEIAEVAAVAVIFVLADLQNGSVEVASIAAWNAVCRYVAAKKKELEADDTLDVAPAAVSSNGTLLAVPPTPPPNDEQLFSSIFQMRLMEYSGHGFIADYATGQLLCSCNGKSQQVKYTTSLKDHLKTKGHEKYETDRLNVTELKRLKDARDVYLQKLESYKNMYCLKGSTCKYCFQIVSKDNGGEKRHASKYSCTHCMHNY